MKTALEYQFLGVSELDMAFPTFDTPRKLIELAKEKGFYNGNTIWNDLFSDWIFSGLDKGPEFKKGIDEKKSQRAMNWAVVYMSSFAPKHEDKEAVCALIFSECLEPSSWEVKTKSTSL